MLLVILVVGLVVHRIVSSVRLRNLAERTQTAVAAMSTTRGFLVPRAIENLEDLPPDMVLAELTTRFTDSPEIRKLSLAYALAHFDDVKIDFLVSEIRTASRDEVDNLVTALGHSHQDGIAALKAGAIKQEADHRNKARIAIVALHLGDASAARDMFQLRPDPIQRTILVDTFESWHGDVARLASAVARSVDAPLRSGVCLGIGGILATDVTTDGKQAWQPLLSDWYQTQPDTGTHSAAGWALRKWRLPRPKIQSSREPVNEREWYVNSLGMTMLRIPAGRFSRSDEHESLAIATAKTTTQEVSRSDEYESLAITTAKARTQEVRLPRPFFLSDREISVALFQQFMDDTDDREEKPKDWIGPSKEFYPTQDHPEGRANWYDAVLFCNWLSCKERLTPCYARRGKKEKEPRFIDGKTVEVEGDVWERVGEANGYRLPTEAEWEYACRAGTVTAFALGDDESLLSKYAVFMGFRIEACGGKLPNGWGLFDMHGSVSEWCADNSNGGDLYGSASATDDPRGPQEGPSRVYRGGSGVGGAVFCRSAYRFWYAPGPRAPGPGHPRRPQSVWQVK